MTARFAGVMNHIVAMAQPPNESANAEVSATDTPSSFEATIGELGQIVEQLERGDLPLEQSLDLFERGMRLSKAAQSRLDAAERRVELLLGFDDADQPITRELDPTAQR